MGPFLALGGGPCYGRIGLVANARGPLSERASRACFFVESPPWRPVDAFHQDARDRQRLRLYEHVRSTAAGRPRALAIEVSDRHFGIGGDGLILIMPSERADARMRMFNADGSEGEMCGNGVRCVAKYLYDHGLTRKQQVTVETGRGILTLDLEVSGGRVQRVRVDMGPPILEAERIPTSCRVIRPWTFRSRSRVDSSPSRPSRRAIHMRWFTWTMLLAFRSNRSVPR